MRAPAPLLSQVRGCTRIKVILENLAPEEAAERHGADRTATRPSLASLRSEATDRKPAPSPGPAAPPPPGDQSRPGTQRGPPPEGPPLPGNQSDQSSGFLLLEPRPLPRTRLLQPSQQALPIDASRGPLLCCVPAGQRQGAPPSCAGLGVCAPGLSMPSIQTPREELPPAFIRQGGQTGSRALLSDSVHPKPPTSLPRSPAFLYQDASFGDPMGVGGRRSVYHRGLAQNTAPGQPPESPRAGPAGPSHGGPSSTFFSSKN